MNSLQEQMTLVLLGVYVLIVSYIGIRNKNKSGSEDYFLASRNLPSWLLAITFIASWWGGGSAIDLADHAFENGINSFWIYGVPVLLSTFLMYLFAKKVRNIPSLSQPQLLGIRYNSKASLLLTFFIMVFMIIGSAIQVIVIGNFFEGYFGFNYELGATIGVVAVLFYSFFGGFKGVVLTDMFQFVFFLITGVALLGVSYYKSGGFDAVEAMAAAKGKPGYTNFFHDVTSNLAYVITFGTSWMIQANVWQRISAARSAIDAKKMMAISFFVFIPLYLMISATGMFASVYYTEVPVGGIIPDMVKHIGSPVISAVLFLGLCSAIMSTMDSMINTASLSITVDFWQKFVNPNADAREQVRVGRVATLLVAMFALFVGTQIRSVLTISWIGSDYMATGVFFPLVLGFLWKRGNSNGAIASMIFGFLFSTYNLLVAMGVTLPVSWEIASVTQALVGMGGSLIIYVVVSLTTQAEYEKAKQFIALSKSGDSDQ